MYMCKNDSIKYKCSAPAEKRIMLPSVEASKHQWVIDVTIHDDITPSQVDELLEGDFYCLDESSGNKVEFSGYSVINNVEMLYANDLSRTVNIQLAKEVTNNAR